MSQVTKTQGEGRIAPQDAADALRDSLTILNSNYTTDEILNHIVRQLVRLFGNDAGVVYLTQNGGLHVHLSLGLEPDELANSVIWRAVAEKRPITVPNSLVGQGPQLERYQALLAVPLVAKEHVYGAISLYFNEARVFSDEDAALAMAFGNQATLAIENAYLRIAAENAAAAERDRIARDLHDSVTQTLFSVTLIAQVLPQLWNQDRGEGERQLEELRLLTRGALAEMRILLLELRPTAFAKIPLTEAVRHLVDAAISRAGIPIKLAISGDTLLSREVKVAFYRIAQEALNNIVKHAEASEAELILVRQQETAELHIRDNGVGFVLDHVPNGHLGLGIMGERAQSIGATLTIATNTGQGTHISVLWRMAGATDGTPRAN